MAIERDFDKLIIKYVKPKVEDNVYNSTPILKRLRGKAKKRQLTDVTRFPLETTTGIAGPMRDFDEISRQRKDITDYAEFELKEYYGSMTISQRDKLVMTGPEAKVNLLQVRAKNAQKELAYQITAGILSDGTTNTKHLVGLQRAIPDTTSNDSTAYGGITGSVDTFWNVALQTDKESTNVTYPDITLAKTRASDGDEQPSAIYTDKYIKDFCHATMLNPQERFVGEAKLTPSEDVIALAGLPVITEPQQESGTSTGGRMYFVDENYLTLYIDSRANFKYFPFQKAVRQFAWTAKWYVACVYACTQRRRHTLIYGITVS